MMVIIDQITADIPSFTVTPQINTASFPEDIDQYNSEMPEVISQQQLLTDELNAIIPQINEATAETVDASTAAIAAANFQGSWTNELTAVGESWEYLGVIYGVLVAGTSSPVSTPENWFALTIAQSIKNVPSGDISSTTVQGAINELDSEKAKAGNVPVDTHSAASKTTPADADEFPLVDTGASNVLKKLTWSNLKANLKTYFDTLYRPIGALLFSDMPAGSVIQVANYTTGTMATGTTTVPADNTIPQNTEGTQFMTTTFTPKKADSKLLVDICVFFAGSAQSNVVAGLFRDSVASALATGWVFVPNANYTVSLRFQKLIDASSTTPTTFNVRIGGTAANTITFNGASAGSFFGGTLASSITITEIAQ